MREKKIGDLEVVVEDCPPERSIENILHIRLAAEPGSQVAAVLGIVSGKMIRHVAQRRLAGRVEPREAGGKETFTCSDVGNSGAS